MTVPFNFLLKYFLLKYGLILIDRLQILNKLLRFIMFNESVTLLTCRTKSFSA